MNNYERYMGMVKGEQVDYVPRIPILMHYAAKHIGASYADFAGDYNTLVKANIALAEDFGVSQLDIMSDPWRETADYGAEIEYLETTCPQCLKHPLEDSKDLSLLTRPEVGKTTRLTAAIKAIEAYKAYGYKEYSITGWVEGPAAEASDIRGVSNFMIDLIDDEEFACELMDLCVDVAIEFAKAQIAAGADTIGVGDAIASQMSADMYERLVFPREKRLVDGIHEAGGLVRLHICGNTNHILPVAASLGVDIIDCDWMVDVVKVRELFPKNTVIAGNLDPVEGIMESTPEKIHQNFIDLYHKVGNPYFVNAGCEVPMDTPKENLQALCKPIQYNSSI
ncbi:uroporphyrinogen decarboxylase family protein [Planctomycetota bacterium]|nr:uroporphyrinogen decarboxylase family protein [Planctomycetota bacterium]